MPRAKSATATAEKKSTSRSKKGAVPSNGTTEVQTSTNHNLNEERIRARAYELYERRGRQDGSHEADWFAAEAELRSRTA